MTSTKERKSRTFSPDFTLTFKIGANLLMCPSEKLSGVQTCYGHEPFCYYTHPNSKILDFGNMYNASPSAAGAWNKVISHNKSHAVSRSNKKVGTKIVVKIHNDAHDCSLSICTAFTKKHTLGGRTPKRTQISEGLLSTGA